jgi:hypothetical protein
MGDDFAFDNGLDIILVFFFFALVSCDSVPSA